MAAPRIVNLSPLIFLSRVDLFEALRLDASSVIVAITSTGGVVNSIMVIHPYKRDGIWAFDDPKVGLMQEPFVCGADEAIGRMVESLPDAENGFTLIFSGSPFPGFQSAFEWRREDMGGNWYYTLDYEMEGWLCPALFKYFDRAPERLYVQVKPRHA